MIYEQPLSEAIRICLRLEKLNRQFTHAVQAGTLDDHVNALELLLETMKLLNRPDLKSKVTQLLAQYNSSFSQLQHAPNVHHDNLKEVRNAIEAYAKQLHLFHGRFTDPLREHEFLNCLQLQANTPGRLCAYSIPSYALWLEQPLSEQNAQLKTWHSTFELLNRTAAFILELTRQSSEENTIQTHDGFYQQALPAHPPCHLIRVTIDASLNVYPEISVGRHRLSIRFVHPSFSAGDRPKQCADDMTFKLTCCQL